MHGNDRQNPNLFLHLRLDFPMGKWSPPANISRPLISTDSQCNLNLYCVSGGAPGAENEDSISVGPIHKPTFASPG